MTGAPTTLFPSRAGALRSGLQQPIPPRRPALPFSRLRPVLPLKWLVLKTVHICREKTAMKVLICGSRDWSDTVVLRARIAAMPADTVIIHGAARGADQDAARMARERGLHEIGFPADWKTYGRRAGILRNLQMLDEKPDLVIAFWDGRSRGTKHTIDEASLRGIPVEVIS